MSKPLPLDEMTIKEKLQTMESIWDDLSTTAGNVPSPDWHKEILTDREQSVSEGSEDSISWNAAKNQIKKDLK